MAFATLWPGLPLDPSTVLLVHLLRCTTMAMALSNKDVHLCHRRSSVHKHLAFGNSLNSVLLLLYNNLKLRYRLTGLFCSLRQHNRICLGLFLMCLCLIVIKLEPD